MCLLILCCVVWLSVVDVGGRFGMKIFSRRRESRETKIATKRWRRRAMM